mmetsp:Transcript_17556/g.28843  ORF Transcript_17556/g.28843 Transcript_17556/m.28843 type:complete len:132 (+) Transcript_17556:885-1280(+)
MGTFLLSPRALPEILNQAISGGVKSAMLFDTKGFILANAGENTNETFTSAIVASIWNTYDTTARDLPNASSLQSLVFDFETRRLIALPVGQGRFILCLLSDLKEPPGLLNAKARALKKAFDTSLQGLTTTL